MTLVATTTVSSAVATKIAPRTTVALPYTAGFFGMLGRSTFAAIKIGPDVDTGAIIAAQRLFAAPMSPITPEPVCQNRGNESCEENPFHTHYTFRGTHHV